jgi:predicted nucleic acid-binding protein
VPFVADASAVLYAITDSSPTARTLLERLRTDNVHAPHLIDAEIGAMLRREVLRRGIEIGSASELLSAYPAFIDHRYEQFGLLAAMAWELRNNLTFYDALYVALAAALDIELVTLDARMASAPNLPARITLASE